MDAAADRAAARAAARMGRGSPLLLRRGMHHVYAADDVVLRISADEGAARRQVAIARRVAALGLPSAAPVDEAAEVDGLAVTVWERIVPVDGAPVDFHGVGEAIAALHRTPVVEIQSAVDLQWCDSPDWLQLDRLVGEIEARRLVAEPDVELLRGRCAALAGWARRARTDAVAVVCHGDVHPQNLVQAAGGPVILDWDGLCLGPPAWDHAPLLTWSSVWGGEPSIYGDFASGYGVDLGADPLATLLADVRLLAATLNMVLGGARSPRRAAEAARRLRYWRGDPDAPPWRPQ